MFISNRHSYCLHSKQVESSYLLKKKKRTVKKKKKEKEGHGNTRYVVKHCIWLCMFNTWKMRKQKHIVVITQIIQSHLEKEK